MIVHHPNELTLACYAAGTIGTGMALAVATHLTFCPTCRAASSLAEDVGGALLEDLPPAAMAPGSLERLLARTSASAIDGGDLAVPLGRRTGASLGARAGAATRSYGTGQTKSGAARADVPPVREPALPPPLNRRAFGPWRPLTFGMRMRPLLPAGCFWAGIVEGAPGRVLPLHDHTGAEFTCVLSGGFSDAEGHYGPGDLVELAAGVGHRPVIDDDGPCVSFIATDGVRLHGVLGFVQRLFMR